MEEAGLLSYDLSNSPSTTGAAWRLPVAAGGPSRTDYDSTLITRQGVSCQWTAAGAISIAILHVTVSLRPEPSAASRPGSGPNVSDGWWPVHIWP